MYYLYSRLSQLLCFIINPLMVVYLTVLALSWWSFGDLSNLALAQKALVASMDALTFSIVDSIVRNLFISLSLQKLNLTNNINKFLSDLRQLAVSTGNARIFPNLDHILRCSLHQRSIKQNEIEIRLKKNHNFPKQNIHNFPKQHPIFVFIENKGN